MLQPQSSSVAYHAYDRSKINPQDWDAFCNEQPDAFVWQRSGWLSYIRDYDPECQERSFIVVDHRQNIRAIVPLFVKGTRVGYGDGDLCPGMVIEMNHTLFERNLMVPMIFAEMRRRLQDVDAGGWWWWTDAPGARKWMKYCCASFPVQSHMWRTSVVDLSQSTDDLLAGIRKTYRHIIRDDEHEIRSNDPEGYVECHMRACPGARPDESYKHNLWWAQSGGAHTVCAYEDGKPVAAAMALLDKGWAYYGSGPSVKGNVQHAVQWRMIRDLKKKGYKFYELGNIDAEGEKEQAISFFKRGFSKDVRAVYGAYTDGNVGESES